MMTPDDNDLKTVRYALIRKRIGIKDEQFRRYWGDVHGPACAKLPGLASYQQFHLGMQQPGLWFSEHDVSVIASPDTQIQGIAECGFREIPDYEAWSSRAEILMEDERNVFSGTYGYYTLNGRSSTVKQASAWQARAGEHVCVLLRMRKGVSQDQFQKLVSDGLAPVFAQYEDVFGVRFHLFEPYAATSGAWHAGSIDHIITDLNRYEAALEFVVSGQLALRQIFDGAVYRATLPDQSALFEAAHAYPVDNAPILVMQGKPTLAGRRGTNVAAIVQELGATNIQ